MYAGILKNLVIILEENERSYPPDKYGNSVTTLPCGDEVKLGWIYDPETQTFSAPVEPEPPVESLGDVKKKKRDEVDLACMNAIIDGVDVELPTGVEHFSLEETDQINLTAALTMVEQGAPSYPYHADGNLCRLYTADEIKAISAAAMSHKLYHTTYCNHLFNWINRAESIEEVKSIYYGATLPDDLLANMTEIMTSAQTI